MSKPAVKQIQENMANLMQEKSSFYATADQQNLSTSQTTINFNTVKRNVNFEVQEDLSVKALKDMKRVQISISIETGYDQNLSYKMLKLYKNNTLIASTIQKSAWDTLVLNYVDYNIEADDLYKVTVEAETSGIKTNTSGSTGNYIQIEEL